MKQMRVQLAFDGKTSDYYVMVPDDTTDSAMHHTILMKLPREYFVHRILRWEEVKR